MTREEAIRLVRLAVRLEPNHEKRAVDLDALRLLLEDLDAAEELLDVFYDDLVERAGDRRARLDQIVFSRRVTRKE
ncbi:MAG TPA: hypothetical protein VKA01_09675 [Vicinamibacteria bacterium]|nr:hypothetical protein [Vicinamibacteria bacterium]